MIYHFYFLPLIIRMGIAFLFSLSLFLFFGKLLIRWLKKSGMVDYFRAYSPLTHESKKGTPTGGGLLLLFCVGVSFFLFGDYFSFYSYLFLFIIFYFGIIGFVDDVIKKHTKSSKGIPVKIRLLLQTAGAIFLGILLYLNPVTGSYVIVPFLNLQVNLNIFYFILVWCIILGSSNAVNLSDGLDGLAAGSMIAPGIVFIILAYIQGSHFLSSFFNRVYIPGSGELGFLWSALLGSLIGLLWYNRYPARIFMGGVGSESLGGVLGVSAVLLKADILLLIIGGVFVVEALSVIIQVISYRLTGKRVFKMAPFHHHLELNGLKEPQIVNRFWIASTLLSGVALMSIIW